MAKQIKINTKPSKPSQQDMMEAKFRALAQEAKQNAQAMLYNLCGNPEALKACPQRVTVTPSTGEEAHTLDLTPLVKATAAAATTFMVEMGNVLGALHDEVIKAAPAE